MKKKHVRLTPELERKYREWLRAQRAGEPTFRQDDEEVERRPLTDADNASIERWMREANVAAIEFEEEEYGDEADNPSETPASPPAPDLLSRLIHWWRGN